MAIWTHGIEEVTGRGGIQVALWSPLPVTAAYELPIQEKFKLKHYLALQYSLPFLTVLGVLQRIYSLHFPTARPQGQTVSPLQRPSIPQCLPITSRIGRLDKNCAVARIPESLLGTISYLLVQVVLNGTACRHATPRSGTGCNHVVSEAAETMPDTKVLD